MNLVKILRALQCLIKSQINHQVMTMRSLSLGTNVSLVSLVFFATTSMASHVGNTQTHGESVVPNGKRVFIYDEDTCVTILSVTRQSDSGSDESDYPVGLTDRQLSEQLRSRLALIGDEGDELFKLINVPFLEAAKKRNQDEISAAKYVGALGTMLFYLSAISPSGQMVTDRRSWMSLIQELNGDEQKELKQIRSDDGDVNILFSRYLVTKHLKRLQSLSESEFRIYLLLRGTVDRPSLNFGSGNFNLNSFDTPNGLQEWNDKILNAIITKFRSGFSLKLRDRHEPLEDTNHLVINQVWPLVVGREHDLDRDQDFLHDLIGHFLNIIKPTPISPEQKAKIAATLIAMKTEAAKKTAHLIIFEGFHENWFHFHSHSHLNSATLLESAPDLRDRILDDLKFDPSLKGYLSPDEFLENFESVLLALAAGYQ